MSSTRSLQKNLLLISVFLILGDLFVLMYNLQNNNKLIGIIGIFHILIVFLIILSMGLNKDLIDKYK